MLPFVLDEPIQKKKTERKKPVQEEKIICKEFFASLSKLKENGYYNKDFLIAHVANETTVTPKAVNPRLHFRDMSKLTSLRQMGVHKGFADYILMVEGGQTILIEFKTSKGRLSEYQEQFKVKCLELGYHYYVPRSVSEGLAILDCYLR